MRSTYFQCLVKGQPITGPTAKATMLARILPVSKAIPNTLASLQRGINQGSFFFRQEGHGYLFTPFDLQYSCAKGHYSPNGIRRPNGVVEHPISTPYPSHHHVGPNGQIEASMEKPESKPSHFYSPFR